jgi:sec-independent protein translocase protein TatA
MGFSGIGFSELLLILVVVLLLFGSKKLPGIASDLGTAIRDFRRSITKSETPESENDTSRGGGDPKA